MLQENMSLVSDKIGHKLAKTATSVAKLAT